MSGEARDLVVFDLDGVLYAGDTFTEFARARFRSPRRLARALGAAARSVLPERSERPHLLARLAIEAVRGMTCEGYEDAARQFGADLAASRRVLGHGIDAVQMHQDAGHEVVVATACEHTMAEAYLRGLGLGVAVIGSDLDPQAGTMRHNRGPAKVHALHSRGYPDRALTTYTDSLTDLPLLRMATRPVIVNPSRSTWRRARRELPAIARVTWR